VKLLLVSLILLAIIGIFWLMVSGGQGKNPVAGVIIIVKNQEPWIEGFIRRLFWSMKSTPRSVLVVDDCSCDGTLEVLGRLQRRYPFELFPVKAGDDVWTVVESKVNMMLFDARGLKGKELLFAPLFSRLSRFGAGKIEDVSK